MSGLGWFGSPWTTCLFALSLLSVSGCADNPAASENAASTPSSQGRASDSGEGAYQAAEDQLSIQKAESGILPPDIVEQIKPRCRALVIAHDAAAASGAPTSGDPEQDLQKENAGGDAIEFVDRPAAPSAEQIAQTELERQLALRRLCEKLGFIRPVDRR